MEDSDPVEKTAEETTDYEDKREKKEDVLKEEKLLIMRKRTAHYGERKRPAMRRPLMSNGIAFHKGGKFSHHGNTGALR